MILGLCIDKNEIPRQLLYAEPDMIIQLSSTGPNTKYIYGNKKQFH